MIKRNQIIGFFVILGLGFLMHGVYEWIPNFITSLFFPVNESIWEHNKLILLSYFLWMIIQFFLYNDSKKNIITSSFVGALLCIFILNLSFTPVYLYVMNANDNFVVTMIFYIVSIILSLIINTKILKKAFNNRWKKISLIGFGISFIVLAILTYNPLFYDIFYDFSKGIYGLE